MSTTFTLSVVRGEQPSANGEELGQSPLEGVDLGAEVWDWLTASGADGTDPDVWVLVTPGDEHPGEVANMVARREVEVDLDLDEAGAEDDAVGWEEAMQASLAQLGDDLDR